MIERFSEQIAEAIATIDSKDVNIAIYKYGLHIIISTLVDIVLALILGVLTNSITEIILFLLIYCSIRIYAGGFHASNSRNCMLLFLLGIITMLIIPKYDYTIWSVLVLIIIENLLVFLFAPVTAVNNPLEKQQKERMKTKAIKINVFWSVFLTLMQCFDFGYSLFGLYAFVWIVLVLIAGQIKIVIYQGGKENVEQM